MSDGDRPERGAIEAGLRFIHEMEIEGRLEQTELVADVGAIKALLIERGVLSEADIADRRQTVLEQQAPLRENRKFPPSFGHIIDKYAVESPDIPCAELVGLCRAACCNLDFSLSIQDLDEGVIRWDYGEPYVIAQDPVTKKCRHFADTGCEVYEQRPGPCRKFDCRSDWRIWKDFENRVPSEHLSTLAPVPVIPAP